MRIPLVAAALLSLPAAATAHGINGHVHVTGWAIESLPPGPLADFFADAEVKDAALIGAAFPDSGYAIDDGYGELAHWEPFVEAHVQYVAELCGPDFATLECRKHVAFLMGGAAHGLQDELFDSLFLFQLMEHDGQGQDAADPGTDAFLFTDGHLRFRPPLYAPFEHLPTVFERAHGHAVTPRTIENGLQRVKFLVIDNFSALAPGFDEEYRPLLPWGSQHYLDPAVPGSLASEVGPTAAYMQALWDRLHGQHALPAVVTWSYPDGGRRLRSVRSGTVDGWITVVFGVGARVGSLSPDTVRLLDADGAPVAVRVQHTRWGGSPDDSTRLVRLLPEADLAHDSVYTVEIGAGVQLMDGRVTVETWSTPVRTPCADPAAEGCADPEPAPFPPPPPPDAAAPDAAIIDAAPPDAAVADAAAAAADAALPDAGPVDRPTPDAGLFDAAPVTRQDAAPAPDAAPPAASSGDDGCAAAPGHRGAPWGLLALPLLALRRRRRRGIPTP